MSSVTQSRHKNLLRDIRKFMRTRPVTQATICNQFGIRKELASILMRELVSMGHATKTHKIRATKTGPLTQVYTLSDSYLAEPQGAEDNTSQEIEAAIAAQIATEMQAAPDLAAATPAIINEPLVENPPPAPPARKRSRYCGDELFVLIPLVCAAVATLLLIVNGAPKL